jgi:hypothetical protein
MKYRKLRIAWSVVWGVVAVLLCVLWVRSYDTWDSAVGCVCNIRVEAESRMNRVLISKPARDAAPGIPSNNHYVHSEHIHRKPPKFTLEAPVTSGIASLMTAIDPNWWKPSEWYENHLGFSLESDQSPWGARIVVPHWFLLLLAASLSGVSWIGVSRRFSLRTLLIVTTLVAVVLGLIVWAVRN